MSEGEEVRGPVQFHRIPVGVGGSREAEVEGSREAEEAEQLRGISKDTRAAVSQRKSGCSRKAFELLISSSEHQNTIQ